MEILHQHDRNLMGLPRVSATRHVPVLQNDEWIASGAVLPTELGCCAFHVGSTIFGSISDKISLSLSSLFSILFVISLYNIL